jgi:hypothetical protein
MRELSRTKCQTNTDLRQWIDRRSIGDQQESRTPQLHLRQCGLFVDRN